MKEEKAGLTPKSNYDVMEEQILQLAEHFKGMFTKEELEDMEKKYDALIETMRAHEEITKDFPEK
jgi:hypothetical protein